MESLEGRALLAAITFDFSSTVSSVNGSSPFIPGDAVTGYVTFESTTPDVLPIPDFGVYEGAVIDASIAVDGNTLPFEEGLTIAIGNDLAGQDMFSAQFVVQGGGESRLVELTFTDTTGLALDSEALTLPDELSFTDRNMTVQDNGWDFSASSVQYALAQPQTVDEAIEDLISVVEDEDLKNGLENSLVSKLNNALKTYFADNAEQRDDFVKKIEAFISAVQAQQGKGIDSSVADELIANAQAIIDSLTT